MNQKISIVVMTYNHDNFLKQCLTSLLSQDYPEDRYEIIVVDDGSTDQTNALIRLLQKEYNNLHYVKHKTNKGVSAARNTGIKNAKYNLVAFVADDYVLPKPYLKEISKFFYQYPLAGIVKFPILNITKKWFTKYENEILQIDLKEQWFPYIKKRSFDMINYLKYILWIKSKKLKVICRSKSFCASGAAAYKQDIFKKVGVFNEDLRMSQDYEFATRLSKKGFFIYFDPKITVKRHSDTSLTELSLRYFNRGISHVQVKKIAQDTDIRIADKAVNITYLLIDMVVVPIKRALETSTPFLPMLLYAFLMRVSYTIGIFVGSVSGRHLS